MAFHGDLSSYPLPDLLQWLDASRKSGALHLTWEAGARRLFLSGGTIVAASAPGLWERLARVLEQGEMVPGGRALAAFRRAEALGEAVDAAVRQVAEEDLVGGLLDLTAASSGRFHWTEDADRAEDEWVALSLPLRSVLFETLRRLDEAPDVERALPHDQLVLHPVAGATVPAHALHRIIVNLLSRGGALPLSRLRLSLGLPRGVLTRAVFELLRAGRAQVDGAPALEADPVAEMLENGAVLVRERQFDAAALVFSALLQSDPGDRRVREFARMVEREHVAALYREFPPVSRFVVATRPELHASLRPEDRTLVAQLGSGWDLSAVVLASSQRELDTLKGVARLVRQGLLQPLEG